MRVGSIKGRSAAVGCDSIECLLKMGCLSGCIGLIVLGVVELVECHC